MERSSNVRKLSFAAMTAAGLLLALATLAAFATGLRQPPLLNGNACIRIQQGWTDETGGEAALPLHLVWEDGTRHSYTAVLPSGPDGLPNPALIFTSRYLNARFYLDGEYLGECLARPEGAKSSQGKVFGTIALPDGYAGRTLRMDVELLLGSGVSYEIPAPCIGARGGILFGILCGELPGLLCDLVVLCFGMLLLLFGLQPRTMQKDGNFLYTGLFAVTFALYSLCVTDSIHLFVPYAHAVYVVEFITLAALPVPLVCGLRGHCGRPWGRLLDVNLALLLANLCLQPALHFFTPLEVRNTVFLTHLALLLTVLLLVPALLKGLSGRERAWLTLSFLPVFIGGLCDLALFYGSATYRESFGLRFGVLLFAMLQTYHLLRSYLKYYETGLQTSLYRRMAYSDALTGLGNRAAFEEKLAELRAGVPEDTALWCVCADVNGLKAVNDTLGHAAGDTLIRDAAALLAEVRCENCTLFRTGGDEFVLFISGQPEAALTAGCERLQARLAEYARTHEVPLSIALGYDRFRPDSGDTVDALVTRADSLMYQDKARWRRTHSL